MIEIIRVSDGYPVQFKINSVEDLREFIRILTEEVSASVTTIPSMTMLREIASANWKSMMRAHWIKGTSMFPVYVEAKFFNRSDAIKIKLMF